MELTKTVDIFFTRGEAYIDDNIYILIRCEMQVHVHRARHKVTIMSMHGAVMFLASRRLDNFSVSFNYTCIDLAYCVNPSNSSRPYE